MNDSLPNASATQQAVPSTSATVDWSAKSVVRSFFQLRFAQVVLLLASLLILAVWTWPAGHMEEQVRWMVVYLITFIATLLLGYWVIFGSVIGARWKVLIILSLVLLPPGLIRRVHFDGNLGIAAIDWRWQSVIDLPEDLAPVQLSLELQEGDSPGFRGADRTGVVEEGPELSRDWNTHPPKLLWKHRISQQGKAGYSGFAVVGGYLFTLEQRDQMEEVVCYDAKTGEKKWKHAYPALFDETMGGRGPRATPTFDQGELFCLGATGELLCLDAATGKVKWQVNILTNNKNLDWGMSGSPLVVDDLVIVNPGAQLPSAADRALIAYHRATGKEVWASGNGRAGYSSPMLVTLAGRRQILLFDGDGLAGYDPATGKPLWRHAWSTQQGINVAQPIVVGANRVFIASGYNTGGALIQVDRTSKGWTTKEVWRTPRTTMRCKFASPVEYQGYLYGLNDGVLECLDLRTGKAVWTHEERRPRKATGAYGHGQLLRWKDLLVLVTEYGEIALVQATPNEFRQLGRIPVLDGEKTWNTPALAHGILYLRNGEEMAACDLRLLQP